MYGVYAEHAEAVRAYSSQLWSELDVGKMMSGTEAVLGRLRKLKSLRLLPVYELVDKEVQGFYNSLPLMKELKSEALRLVCELQQSSTRSTGAAPHVVASLWRSARACVCSWLPSGSGTGAA